MAAAPTEPGYDTASGPLTNGPDSDEPAFLIPDLTLTGGEGDIIILRHTDRDMQPAMVAHWSLNVEPGELMLVDYPFLSGDNLEMSIFGSRLDLVYMESPSGRRMLELKDEEIPEFPAYGFEIAEDGEQAAVPEAATAPSGD